METDHSFTQLLTAIQARDDSLAKYEIWQRAWPRLLSLVGRRLNRKFCAAADEEDVALSAMNSIFEGIAAKEFQQLDDRNSFWNLLLTIACTKAIKHHHRETAQRGGGRVLNEAALDDSQASTAGLAAGAESGPTEEEVAVIAEEMVEQLADDSLRKIAMLKFQGYTDKEVAGKLGVVEKTIERKRKRIKAIWSAVC